MPASLFTRYSDLSSSTSTRMEVDEGSVAEMQSSNGAASVAESSTTSSPSSSHGKNAAQNGLKNSKKNVIELVESGQQNSVVLRHIRV